MAPTGGRVILWSGGGQAALENFSDYVTGKGGIWRLVETLGVELARKNIYVNAIAPGPVNTQFVDELLQAGPARVGQAFYDKTVQQKNDTSLSPAKTVQLCKYLLSEKSEGLFGKTISALWDDYENWGRYREDLLNLSQSDMFTFKRVVDATGGTRPKK